MNLRPFLQQSALLTGHVGGFWFLLLLLLLLHRGSGRFLTSCCWNPKSNYGEEGRKKRLLHGFLLPPSIYWPPISFECLLSLERLTAPAASWAGLAERFSDRAFSAASSEPCLERHRRSCPSQPTPLPPTKASRIDRKLAP